MGIYRDLQGFIGDIMDNTLWFKHEKMVVLMGFNQQTMVIFFLKWDINYDE